MKRRTLIAGLAVIPVAGLASLSCATPRTRAPGTDPEPAPGPRRGNGGGGDGGGGGGGGGGDGVTNTVKPFTFDVDGVQRRAFFKGDTTDPRGLIVWLDGGQNVNGQGYITNHVVSVPDILDVGPSGQQHADGSSTFVKTWTPEDSVLKPGVTRDSDVRMLDELARYMTKRQPTI